MRVFVDAALAVIDPAVFSEGVDHPSAEVQQSDDAVRGLRARQLRDVAARQTPWLRDAMQFANQESEMLEELLCRRAVPDVALARRVGEQRSEGR